MLQDVQRGGVGEDVDVERDFSLEDFPNQIRMGDQVTDSDAGCAEGLGEGFEYDQIRVAGQEVQGGGVAEFPVGLIDHDQGVL